MKLLKIVKDLQSLIIGLLVLFLLYQKNSKDTFIEDRNAEFKTFEDSITAVNNNLTIENLGLSTRIDSIENQTALIDNDIDSIDRSLERMSENHEEERHTVYTLNADSTVRLLTSNLSARDST